MESSATRQEIRARIRWWHFAVLLLAVAFQKTAFSQTGVPDAVAARAQTAACDAKYSACQLTCMTSPECEACKKEWLDCKGKTAADILEIIRGLPALVLPGIPSERYKPGPPAGKKQSDRAHIVDGCSVPGFAGGQDPCGCVLGKGSTEFGRPQGNDDNEMGEGDQVLDLPCNQHDICYQTCGSVRSKCDEQMYTDMIAVCNRAYPEASCPFSDSTESCVGGCDEKCNQWYDERERCAKKAQKYKSGLDKLGWPAYKQRQWQFCESVEGP